MTPSASRRSLRPGFLAGLLLLHGAVASAAPADEPCMTCHAEAALSRSDPARGESVHVDGALLQGSVHGRLACADCHAGTGDAPHPERLPAVQCARCHEPAAGEARRGVHAAAWVSCVSCHGSHGIQPGERTEPESCAPCHARAGADYRGSVHGVALAAGDHDAPTCRSCHGPAHRVQSHRDPGAPTHRSTLAETCARCHADRELVTRRKITIPEAYALYRRSVHGRSKDPQAATCSDCHESHRLRRATDPSSSIHRANLPSTCGRCHAEQERAYRRGVHGQGLARGVTASPTCTDCHGEHRIRGPADPQSPVAAAGLTRTCAHCHEAEGIRETFGLPAGRLSSYLDSFHGLAARGGSPAVANCASCHGAHEILPSSDPRSAIHPANLPATCGKCHEGAGPRFASSRVHVATTAPGHPAVLWARRIYLALIAVVVSAMMVHNGLHFVRKLRHSLSRHQQGEAVPAGASSGGGYVRMTRTERWQHGLLAASFFTLVYTGFALKFPESWPFAWLARLEQGYAWRSIVHRVAALVMVASGLFHVGYLFTRRGRGLWRDLLPGRADLRGLGAALLYFVGRRAEPPAAGRFGYVEKAEYWALIWGTVIMTVTGFALWFEKETLRFLNLWVLDLATVVHYYEAWLAFLSILVWHLYWTVLNPDVYPMNWTWVTGRVTEEQMRHEHRLEWERLQAEEAAAAEQPEAPAGGEGQPAAPPAPETGGGDPGPGAA